MSGPPLSEDDEPSGPNRGTLVALIAVVVLAALGYWAFTAIDHMRKVQNCLDEGRKNCMELETRSRLGQAAAAPVWQRRHDLSGLTVETCRFATWARLQHCPNVQNSGHKLSRLGVKVIFSRLCAGISGRLQLPTPVVLSLSKDASARADGASWNILRLALLRIAAEG